MRRSLFFSIIFSGIILLTFSCHTQKSGNGSAESRNVVTPVSAGVSHDSVNKNAEIKNPGADQKAIDSIKEIKNKKKDF